MVRAIAELDAPSFILDGEIAIFDRQLASERQLIIPVRRLRANGLEAWDEVLRNNYESMIAKDPGSAYTLGRTLSWLKVKQRGYRQEARGFHQG